MTIETETISMEPADAALALRKYREHRAYQKPIDAEIEQLYRLISRGKIVIRALASIVKAGVGEDGLPRLALARADSLKCYLRAYRSGAARMADAQSHVGKPARGRVFTFGYGSFAFPEKKTGRYWEDFSAVTPHIPPDVRPARGLQNYHLLWEATWKREPPVDPMLLRRIGNGDTWLVCAAWDLTPVERAAMSSRL